MSPPLVLDIDGTLTRPDESLDNRVLEPLRGWEAPIVIATGKHLPYVTALCRLIGIPPNCIAENGGVVHANGDIEYIGDGKAAQSVIEAYQDAGHSLGWEESDLLNKWRETQVVVSPEAPLEPLKSIAEEHGLHVIDTGYGYHVKNPNIDKGTALRRVAKRLGVDLEMFVAIGDSINDVSTFQVTGRAFAVANADESARRAADEVTDGEYADGTLEVLYSIR